MDAFKLFDDILPVERVDLIPGAFLLKNVLSPKQCQYFIEQSEEEGYSPLKVRFRTNERVIVPNQDVADYCYERVKDFIPDTISINENESDLLWNVSRRAEIIKETAHSFDIGSWKCEKMNEQWRFCRYTSGGFFYPHRDGCYIESENQRSILTFNLYLNKTDGGATNFIEGTSRKLGENEVIAAVQPEPGTALVFVHWMFHEGSKLTSGLKYLMRSDIMFKRVDEPIDKDKAISWACLRQAEAFENQNRPHDAVPLYKTAFRLNPEIERFC